MKKINKNLDHLKSYYLEVFLKESIVSPLPGITPGL